MSLVLVGLDAAGSWFSCLLLLRNGLWLWKNPVFFFGSGLSSMDCSVGGGMGFPGDAVPLGGSMLENEVGFE